MGVFWPESVALLVNGKARMSECPVSGPVATTTDHRMFLSTTRTCSDLRRKHFLLVLFGHCDYHVNRRLLSIEKFDYRLAGRWFILCNDSNVCRDFWCKDKKRIKPSRAVTICIAASD